MYVNWDNKKWSKECSEYFLPIYNGNQKSVTEVLNSEQSCSAV